MNRATITISAILAIGSVCLTVNGQRASSGSHGASGSSGAKGVDGEPQVQSMTSPSFSPTNYNKIAIVWLNPPKQPQADSSEQSIDDEFTFALMQKGYDVVPSSDAQSLLKEQPAAKTPGAAETETTKIGKLLNVPAVMVISLSGLNSKPYTPPPPTEKTSPSTSSAAGGGTNPLAGMPNPLQYITAPTNTIKFHGWGFKLPGEASAAQDDTESKAGKTRAAQPKAAEPAATGASKGAGPAAAKAGPQFMNTCSMSARLYSVADDHILWIGKVTVGAVSASAQDYSDSIKSAADAIAGAIPSGTEAK